MDLLQVLRSRTVKKKQSLLFRARMMVQDSLLPSLGVDVGVDLGSHYGFVPEHLLHRTQVGAILNKMSGEGVAEGMRRYLLADAGQQSLTLDHIEYGYAAQRTAEIIEEGHIIESRFCRLRPRIKINLEGIGCHLP